MDSSNEPSSFIARQEQHLLACARDGDAEAFETLLRPHRNRLLRVSQRILRNREDAEDAVQTALLNAWRNINTFEGRSRFATWITRIVMNSAFMQLRAKRCKKELSLDEMVEADSTLTFHVIDARPNPEREFSSKEALRLIESALRRLEPHYSEVFEMSVVHGLVGKEVAQILNLTVPTVKSRLFRARNILSRSVRPMISSRRQCPMSQSR